MQFFEPLVSKFDITAFGSLTSYHDRFAFPVVKLSSPMDLPDVRYKLPVLNRLFTDAHYLWGLEDKLRGFDLVHTAETYFHYTQQSLDAKKNGYVKKVIATVLENIPFNNESIWGRKRYKERARNELDHIIALTEKTKKTLISEGTDPRKISVISHFVDTKRFRPSKEVISRRAANRKEFTILFTGRLEEYKGVIDVLSAVHSLTHDQDLKHVKVTVLFVGTGSQKNKMRGMEQALGIDAIHLTANYDDMPAMYKRGDIFVAPSKPRIVNVRGKPTATWEEQYCTALLEAQAAGLPIVTTNSGGIPENIGDAGIMVEPGNIADLAAALKSFIISPVKRETYGQKARMRAQSVHDIQIGARKLSEVYTRVLSQS